MAAVAVEVPSVQDFLSQPIQEMPNIQTDVHAASADPVKAKEASEVDISSHPADEADHFDGIEDVKQTVDMFFNGENRDSTGLVRAVLKCISVPKPGAPLFLSSSPTAGEVRAQSNSLQQASSGTNSSMPDGYDPLNPGYFSGTSASNYDNQQSQQFFSQQPPLQQHHQPNHQHRQSVHYPPFPQTHMHQQFYSLQQQDNLGPNSNYPHHNGYQHRQPMTDFQRSNPFSGQSHDNTSNWQFTQSYTQAPHQHALPTHSQQSPGQHNGPPQHMLGNGFAPSFQGFPAPGPQLHEPYVSMPESASGYQFPLQQNTPQNFQNTENVSGSGVASHLLYLPPPSSFVEQGEGNALNHANHSGWLPASNDFSTNQTINSQQNAQQSSKFDTTVHSILNRESSAHRSKKGRTSTRAVEWYSNTPSGDGKDTSVRSREPDVPSAVELVQYTRSLTPIFAIDTEREARMKGFIADLLEEKRRLKEENAKLCEKMRAKEKTDARLAADLKDQQDKLAQANNTSKKRQEDNKALSAEVEALKSKLNGLTVDAKALQELRGLNAFHMRHIEVLKAKMQEQDKRIQARKEAFASKVHDYEVQLEKREQEILKKEKEFEKKRLEFLATKRKELKRLKSAVVQGASGNEHEDTVSLCSTCSVLLEQKKKLVHIIHQYKKKTKHLKDMVREKATSMEATLNSVQHELRQISSNQVETKP